MATTSKPLTVFCLYASQGGSTKKLAESARDRLTALFGQDESFQCECEDLATFNPDILVSTNDDLIYAGDDSQSSNSIQNRQLVALFFVSTYYGKAPKSCLPFQKWLEDFTLDFRVSRNAMKNLLYSIFSVGDSDFSKNLDELERQAQKAQNNEEAVYSKSGGLIGSKFNAFGKFLNKNLSKLEARRLLSLFLADKGTSVADKSPFDKQFERWMKKCENVLSNLEKKKNLPGKQEIKKQDSETPNVEDDDDDLENDNVCELQDGDDSDLDDIEELIPTDTTGMVSDKLKVELKKQGYFLVGKNKHSAVKLCRWAKAQVRGRGACYKHTAYGIQSYHCMEMTASIGCANKCVFCWRHHSNPVVTGWNEQWIANGLTDSAKEIFEESIKAQTHLIKSLRGVPGAKLDRFKDALENGPRHAALSLIGEPIIYPYINELINYLHERKISTFMVTNAQFPERIKQLNPVTQLYISVDAPSPDELALVDRPIFQDFWERLNQSIEIIGKRTERTVYRLTLVKGWNAFGQERKEISEKIEISENPEEKQKQIAEIQAENYAKLIWKGKPDFIEVKGMTYSGNAKNDIQITNVPYFNEIDDFSKLIVEKLKILKKKEEIETGKECAFDYGCSVAHEHTLFVLIANSKKFLRNVKNPETSEIAPKWHTWIDFEKFFELYQKWQNDKENFIINGEDYCLPTPDWAVYGAPEKGFDPTETRFRDKPVK